jgi:hypothetical protein
MRRAGYRRSQKMLEHLDGGNRPFGQGFRGCAGFSSATFAHGAILEFRPAE